MLTLSTPIAEISPIGKTLAARIKTLGIQTAQDLLCYFPRKYLDFSTVTPIKRLEADMETTVAGRIEQIKSRRSWKRRMIVTEAIVADDTGSVAVVWFGQHHVGKILKAGDDVLLAGKATVGEYGLQMVSPVFEKNTGANIHTGRLVPLYPLTSRVSQKQIRTLIKYVLRLAKNIPDFLPSLIRSEERLMALPAALEQIHFPANHAFLSRAQNRLKFDELFLIQTIHAKRKMETAVLSAPKVPFREEHIKSFVRSLPFTLTDAQRKAAWQIIKNMERPHPMNRLLEGDVGSGKTVIAAMALFNTVLSGFQAALMAPTEILAKQHFDTIKKLLSPAGVTVALVTSSWKKIGDEDVPAKTMSAKIKSGETQIIIGTHALIQDRVQFKHLGLAVIDEQHRFGVAQRMKLRAKSGVDLVPHLLSMTATPIPRTLFLTLYGDLDLSVLDELPKGRQAIQTKIVAPHERPSTLSFIDKEIENGRQIFVLCPLIDESDKLGAKAAKAEFEKLQKTTFAHRRMGLLHGKMNAEEKDSVMKRFADGSLDILVSTPVVEVGVDIPNASVMMIENAERFGLSQIWQLRGRVGRGKHQSHCFLFPETDSVDSMKRLHAVLKSKNGFELAEKDLELRGPGEVYGTAQSGFANDLRIATLLDWKIIDQAKQAAEMLLSQDATLQKFPILYEKITAVEKRLHFE